MTNDLQIAVDALLEAELALEPDATDVERDVARRVVAVALEAIGRWNGYRQTLTPQRRKALDELAAEAQRLGLGY